MSDSTMLKHGHFAKGLIYLQRKETSSALEAFKAADDFPNARRQLPFILKDLQASPTEIMSALVAALDSGDLQALPWIVRFNDEFRFDHPDIKLFKRNLKEAEKNEDQSVLLGLMRIAREDQKYKEYMSLMIQLIQLGNPNAKCEMVNLVMQGPGYLDEYEALRKQQGKLPVLNGVKPNFKSIPKGFGEASQTAENTEETFLDSNDFAYLAALLNQGEESITSGANLLKYFLDMSMRRFETFTEYVAELTESQDSRWEDPHYLLVFTTELRTFFPNHDITVFRQILQKFGLDEFLDQLLEEIPEQIPESLFDDGPTEFIRTPSKVSPEKAFEFFKKYDSPLFNEFVESFKLSPVAAGRKYSDFMAKAIDGSTEYFQCSAAALEFIDRGYFDFDLVDPMLHGLVMKKLPALIDTSTGFSTEFLEYLYQFEGGQAYFQEDIRRRLVRHPNASTSIRDDFYSQRD